MLRPDDMSNTMEQLRRTTSDDGGRRRLALRPVNTGSSHVRVPLGRRWHRQRRRVKQQARCRLRIAALRLSPFDWTCRRRASRQLIRRWRSVATSLSVAQEHASRSCSKRGVPDHRGVDDVRSARHSLSARGNSRQTLAVRPTLMGAVRLLPHRTAPMRRRSGRRYRERCCPLG